MVLEVYDEGDVVLLPAFLLGIAYIPAGLALRRLEALGVAENEAVLLSGPVHFRKIALCLSAVAVKDENERAVRSQTVRHKEVILALLSGVL